MTTAADKAANIDVAERLVREAKARGADWVQIPEMFPFIGTYDRVFDMAETEDGPLNRRLAALAKELGIVLVAGTVGERPHAGEVRESDLHSRERHRRVFNTCFIFGRDGALVSKYRKTHLF